MAAMGPASWRAILEFLPDPVLVLDHALHVTFCNPAFECVFGWAMDDIIGQAIDFVPLDQASATAAKIEQLHQGKTLHGFRTWRLTKTGARVDVIMDAALLDDGQGRPAGLAMTMRDVTRQRRRARSRHILLRMSGALHRFRQLDALLGYVTRLIRVLMGVDGVSVILLDADAKEFFFQKASFVDPDVGRKFQGLRFPVDQGAAGQVYRTGKPLVVSDYARSPYALKMVDAYLDYDTRTMLDAPLRVQDRIVGVLCAVNKRDGGFDAQDVELLCAIADVVALPIENVRMNSALKEAYEQVRQHHRAKARVIHHLSHELKTPLAVLSASMRLLDRGTACPGDPRWLRIHERIDRNLLRLLEMEYKLEDILRAGDDAYDDLEKPGTLEGERLGRKVSE
jgi:PAS domain S-box-containing protein